MSEIDWAGPATPQALGVFASAVTQPATPLALIVEDVCHGLRVLEAEWPIDAAAKAAEALGLVREGHEGTR